MALVGPNGAGKSTRLRVLAGVLPIDGGERIVGHNVQIALFAQHQLEALDPARRVIDELASIASTDDVPRLRGHLGAFLFSGEDVEKRVSVLSGGEKARLALAKMLLRPANVLILDEPTNHLDVAACEVLEAALCEYQGTVVVISHDRAFLNAVATRVVEVRAGMLREFPGNYDDFLRESSAAGGSARGAVRGHGVPHAPVVADERPKRAGDDRHGWKRWWRPSASSAQTRAGTRAPENARTNGRNWRCSRRHPRARVRSRRSAGGSPIRRSTATHQVRAIEADRAAAKATVDALYREWERFAAEIEALDTALATAEAG